jgi:hypothetical protein
MPRNLVFLNFGQFGQLPKNIKNKIIFFYYIKYIHMIISTRKVMIYSMFTSEEYNMRSFVLRAVMTFFGKNNI